MRISFSSQLRLDCNSIEQVQLNTACRDEIIPILAALQYLYSDISLRESVLDLIASDVNKLTRDDVGREGLSYWEILVLASVRLGCNLDYDKLQDLAENHRNLRHIMGIGDWQPDFNFSWRRIRDSVCLLQPETIEKVNQLIVKCGQELHGDAQSRVRADSFVIETNIHYPTESKLIWDGVRKIFDVSKFLLKYVSMPGWRQASQLRKRIKEQVRKISLISSSKSPKTKAGLPKAYEALLGRATNLLDRAKKLVKKTRKHRNVKLGLKAEALQEWIKLTEQVCDTARRRVLLGEQVPNQEKLFSLFETHTQLYRRGKAGTPNQFGRLVLVFEDAAGFISHYHLMPRDALDSDVIVEQTRQVQKLHDGKIESVSFDRGFYSPQNAIDLATIVESPCLPPRPPKEYAEALKNGSVEFRKLRHHHAGIESAIGALQSGNGLKRCRDRTEGGMERYIGLAILGRNLHTLGKLLIAKADTQSEAAYSKRKIA